MTVSHDSMVTATWSITGHCPTLASSSLLQQGDIAMLAQELINPAVYAPYSIRRSPVSPQVPVGTEHRVYSVLRSRLPLLLFTLLGYLGRDKYLPRALIIVECKMRRHAEDLGHCWVCRELAGCYIWEPTQKRRLVGHTKTERSHVSQDQRTARVNQRKRENK